jgi:hypothetical protein
MRLFQKKSKNSTFANFCQFYELKITFWKKSGKKSETCQNSREKGRSSTNTKRVLLARISENWKPYFISQHRESNIFQILFLRFFEIFCTFLDWIFIYFYRLFGLDSTKNWQFFKLCAIFTFFRGRGTHQRHSYKEYSQKSFFGHFLLISATFYEIKIT